MWTKCELWVGTGWPEHQEGGRGGQNIGQWKSRRSQGTHGLIDTGQEFRVYLGHTWKPKKDDKRRRKSLIGLKIFFPRCLETR